MLTWWHLVYTYDGAIVRLYVNGEPAGEKVVTLNTHGDDNIRIGAQGDNDGRPTQGERNFTGAIAQVRIHDGVLTAAQIRKNARIPIQVAKKASNPRPKDGDLDVPNRDLLLSWQPGD